MRTLRTVSAAALAAGLVLSIPAVSMAQQTTGENGQNQTSAQAGQQNWTAEQLITSSVHDAWVMSGRNEKTFFEMVSQLAQISAQKRGVTLPDSEAAGKHFGELIKTMAKADHDQLLYVIVDKAVQQVGTKSGS